MKRWEETTHRFDYIVEVALRGKDTAGPPDNPVAIWHQACALRGATFQDIENMPDVVHCELGFAHPHAETE